MLGATEYLAKYVAAICGQKGSAFADDFVIGAEILFTFRVVVAPAGELVDNDGGATAE